MAKETPRFLENTQCKFNFHKCKCQMKSGGQCWGLGLELGGCLLNIVVIKYLTRMGTLYHICFLQYYNLSSLGPRSQLLEVQGASSDLVAACRSMIQQRREGDPVKFCGPWRGLPCGPGAPCWLRVSVARCHDGHDKLTSQHPPVKHIHSDTNPG